MGKTLFLHIGTQKTGTTSIQTFLTKKQSTLLDHGFFYPDPDQVSIGLDGLNHGHLALTLTGYWRDTPIKLNAEDAWDKLRDLYLNYKKHLVISTELLSTPQIVPHHQFISRYLEDINVKVIIYLRRQDLFVQSVYKERLKVGERRSFHQAYEQDDYKQVLDFYFILNSWRNWLGKDSIIVRPYEKNQLVNGDVLDDFLKITELNKIPGLEPPIHPENKSFNRHALELSRELNLLDISGPQLTSFKYWLNEVLGGENEKTFSNHAIISPEDCLKILSVYQQNNEKVAREFLDRPDGKLFYDPLPDANENWKPYTGLPAKEVAKILLAMFKKYNVFN